ncbi:hypothetical protein [Actinocrispum wychmicini]|uniref:Uncharacterized protein n=1 Tax=Actinocrispum wychmicini TaxID=1213861 RepID=A0A4R2J4C4_9PSEU|nr:hypothetical protein [Actinocrispum wychmicini]TCO53541.1 hypothetical protein EV192_110130 [Actinocrispum wychmicini]
MITETDEIASALNYAADQWPDERNSRGKLLVHLIEEGHRALRKQREAAAAKRREAIRRSSGKYDDVYEEGYLEKLREDWPA